MNYNDKITKITRDNNGYITNRLLKENNIPTIYLTRSVNEERLIKVDRGIYMIPSLIEDELYILQIRHPKIVYSGHTAVFLNEMSNRSLKVIEANVPFNYNPHRIKNITINRVNDVLYSLGVIYIETSFGNKVRTYDKERVLCDIFLENKLESEEIKFALDIARKKGIDQEKLFNYAEKLKILDYIKILLEVL